MQTDHVEVEPERRRTSRRLRPGRRTWVLLALVVTIALLIGLTLYLKSLPPGLRHGVWVSQGQTEQLALEFTSGRGLVTGRIGELRRGRKILEWKFAGTRERPHRLELNWGRGVVLRGTGPIFFRRVLSRDVVKEPGTRFLYIGADVNLLAGVLHFLWWRVPLFGEDASRQILVASGWGSQFIHIVPHLDVVLVTTGGNNFNGRTFDFGAVLKRHLKPAFEP